MTCPICDYLTGLRDAAASGSYESNIAITKLAEHEQRYHPERCVHGRYECNLNHVPEFVKSQPD